MFLVWLFCLKNNHNRPGIEGVTFESIDYFFIVSGMLENFVNIKTETGSVSDIKQEFEEEAYMKMFNTFVKSVTKALRTRATWRDIWKLHMFNTIVISVTKVLLISQLWKIILQVFTRMFDTNVINVIKYIVWRDCWTNISKGHTRQFKALNDIH